MSDLLSIGGSGLAAYRAALNAVGENVANAETPGYSRRRVNLKESLVTGGANVAYRAPILFNGVTTAGVERAWDQFKATEARFATSAAGRAEVREQWLTSIEGALGDGPAGVGASMTKFFNATTSLAGDPGDTLGRSSMLTALADVSGAFRNSADALARISKGLEDSAKLDATAVNNALTALYNLNGTIRSAGPGGSARAGLEDQRDQLIDLISSKIDVNVSIAQNGTVELTAGTDSSISLLNGIAPAQLNLTAATDGRLSLSVATNGGVLAMPASGGTISAFVELSANAADRRAALDALAADFTATVNSWSAAGVDANGNPGANILEAPTGASSMRVLTSDPALIAAASTGGVPNGNLIALEGLRESSGVERRWGNLVSDNAQILASARSEAAAASSWRDFSKAALDEVTGVDLDFEAAELLRYQQAYNASARIIQVARETIDALFAAF